MAKLNVVLARNIDSVSKSICDFSHTVAFSHYNNLSAQLPVDKSGVIVSDKVDEQATKCMQNIEQIITGINHKLDDIVRLTIFATSKNDLDVIQNSVSSFFKTYKPALTLLVVNKLPLNAKVQIEAVITCGEGTIPDAPQPGDLIKLSRNTNLVFEDKNSTQTVAFSHYNHLSSQLPIDKNGNLVGSSVEEQLKQALTNVKLILNSIDVPFDDIVKLNIYTTSYENKDKILEVHKTFFPDSAIARAVNYLPALSIIEVKELKLGAKVQVEAVISHGDGTPPQLVEDRHGIVIRTSKTCKAPKCCHSTQSVAFSHYNNISEIAPIDLATKKLVDGSFESQLELCLKYLNEIVLSCNHNINDVVKINFFVKNIDDYTKINGVMKKFFSGLLPAGRVIEVSNLRANALVTIDAIVSNAEGTPPVNE